MKTGDNKHFYGKAFHSSRGIYAAGTGDHPMGAVRSYPSGQNPSRGNNGVRCPAGTIVLDRIAVD
jgi:hypothetical protein